MDVHKLIPYEVELSDRRFGEPQKSGALTVLPIFGKEAEGDYGSPLSSLKIASVKGYGNVELLNPGNKGVVIVPLHIGYIQHGAQNHALCGSGFISAGQKRMFNDACCVQSGQGGFLESREQWFFILPLELRAKALELRGKPGYSKLWEDISRVNAKYDLPSRGHLDELICKKRPYLNQFLNRFERLDGQTGAVFMMGDRVVGVEISQTADYFSEIWMASLCFCFGPPAMHLEKKSSDMVTGGELPAFDAKNLQELRDELQRSRGEARENVQRIMSATPAQKFEISEEEKYLELRLLTVTSAEFCGQIVVNGDRMVYASLFVSKV